MAGKLVAMNVCHEQWVGWSMPLQQFTIKAGDQDGACEKPSSILGLDTMNQTSFFVEGSLLAG